MADSDSLLLVFRHAPSDGSLARSGIDAALAAAAFDQSVTVLFMDDGVFQLLPEQDSKQLPGANLARLIDSFALYDIEELYVDSHSLRQRSLQPEHISGAVTVLDAAGCKSVFNNHLRRLSF